MSLKVHFDMSMSPPAYSPPPAYIAHAFNEMTTFAQKERMASIAEHKLGYLVSQKRREPSLRKVLLHAGFLERVLDSLDATHPEEEEEEVMIEEKQESLYTPEIHASLSTIVEEVEESDSDDEEEEMDVDEEDGAPLQRTLSHRPGSPVSDDSDSDDDELPSPPPVYTAPDHPLFNLFEVREKARRDELSHQYKIDHEPENMFLLNHNLAVAA